MSELMYGTDSCALRWQLLSTVSTLTLLALSYSAGDVYAADADPDRPTVWIELGGTLNHVSGQGDAFALGFVNANPTSPVLHPVNPLQAQNPSPFGFGEEGKISVQPNNSDWVFSVEVNYGRSNNFKLVDHQTLGVHYGHYVDNVPVDEVRTQADFSNTRAQHRESHAILDFCAGKDVGLGLFGRESSSVLSLGVRFAQFASSATLDVRARPDLHLKYYPSAHAPTRYQGAIFHTYHASGSASRSFQGVGPSLSWNGSAPVAGIPNNGEIALDWGASGAVLFGKQKAQVKHQEAGHYHAPLSELGQDYYALVYQHSGGHNTDRSVIVPNVGGFAGLTFRLDNFKMSAGYRADFFFGAVDGGIDARKSETLGFYGPFATISVGLL